MTRASFFISSTTPPNRFRAEFGKWNFYTNQFSTSSSSCCIYQGSMRGRSETFFITFRFPRETYQGKCIYCVTYRMGNERFSSGVMNCLKVGWNSGQWKFCGELFVGLRYYADEAFVTFFWWFFMQEKKLLNKVLLFLITLFTQKFALRNNYLM